MPGPMAIFVDQLIAARFHYSCLEMGCVRFISEQSLARIGKDLVKKRRPVLPGKKKKRETGYFERNARALAVKAKSLMAELGDEVVSILFRDADGTASTCRGLYEDKRDSILRGFEMEEYAQGVPMVPKPKSEAWLLCALKQNPYQHCDVLENASGNDNSPNDLKTQLDNRMGRRLSAEELTDMARDRTIDVHQIKMTSMKWFKKRLVSVLNA